MQQPTLTFLHGFMGQGSDWNEVRSKLDDQFGLSETTALDIRPAESWRASLQQTAEQLNRGTIVIGYSMGARMALGLALDFPKLIGGLVFVSGNPGLETEEGRRERLKSDQRLANEIEAYARSNTIGSFLKRWYESEVFSGTPSWLRDEEVDRKRQHSPRNWPTILRSHSVALQPNYWRRLGELEMPVLIVAGQADEKYRQIAVRISKKFPQSNFDVKIIPDCGHIVHREQRDAFVRCVADFARSIKRMV